MAKSTSEQRTTGHRTCWLMLYIPSPLAYYNERGTTGARCNIHRNIPSSFLFFLSCFAFAIWLITMRPNSGT